MLISLAKKTAALGKPADYFSGLGGDPWCWPRNLIAFVRRSRRDLQRRTFQSRLHTRYVLVVNLSTAGTLNLDSTPYRLNPGECHLIFPHQLHTYHDVDREKILWLFITFELPDDAPLRALRQSTLAVDLEMQRLLGNFLAAYNDPKKNTPHRVQSLLSEILLQLVETCGHSASSYPSQPGSNDKLLDSIHRCHIRSLPGAVTVQEVAAQLNMSESWLRSRFRKTFGLGLGEYLRNLRLQESVAMICHSQASLTEIALSCGFGSSSAFSRAFRNWAGMGPRAFRVSSRTPNSDRHLTRSQLKNL